MTPAKTKETRRRKSTTKSVKKIPQGKVKNLVQEIEEKEGKTVDKKQEKESSRKKGNLAQRITGNCLAAKPVKKLKGGGGKENKITNFLEKINLELKGRGEPGTPKVGDISALSSNHLNNPLFAAKLSRLGQGNTDQPRRGLQTGPRQDRNWTSSTARDWTDRVVEDSSPPTGRSVTARTRKEPSQTPQPASSS